MKFELMHPADQLVLMMNRIYQGGMTTVSGGNLSILDENGDIWITPSGIDKGTLTRNDMCRVTPSGEIFGPHKPSVELPFHATVYKRRPDLRAVLHAHPPALVAFSVARVLPEVRLVGNAYQTLGSITMASYAVPGSQTLGDYISAKFEKGFDIVVMENHGVVVGAEDLFKAYMKFETLEFSASLEIYARKLGTPQSLTESEINLSNTRDHFTMEEFTPGKRSADECAARRDMITLIHRSYRQKLFTGTQGTFSVRLSDGSFLITPDAMPTRELRGMSGEHNLAPCCQSLNGVLPYCDRAYMEESDLVLIKNGKRENGKIPSRSVVFHQKVYENYPEANAILASNPPYAMAFAVTDTPFDPRTIPESYIMLREVQKVPFGAMYLKPDETAAMFSARTPAMICGNNQVIVAGSSLINAFDRLEVMEATAHSIIAAKEIGALVHISDSEVAEINTAFNLN